ncbi:hypothetical protein DFJ73DRAFT_835970 [Zopfochytrium polystomum]|nr:hypothetical protein DFJ73DRAFT_835970 [Zopfochytrium polystomum]
MDKTWFCHACEDEIEPVEDEGGSTTCPLCGSDFVESFEGGQPPPIGDDDLDDDEAFDDDDDDDFDPTGPDADRSRALVQTMAQLIQQLEIARPSSDLSASADEAMRRTEVISRLAMAMGGGDVSMSGVSRPSVPNAARNDASAESGSTEHGTGSSTEGNPPPSLGSQVDNEVDGTPGTIQRSEQSHNSDDELRRAFYAQLGVLFQSLLSSDGLGVDRMVGNPGDYVFGQQSLDRVITQLMEQNTISNAPPPASDATIAALKRVTVKGSELGDHPECSVCQEDFTSDEQGEVAVRLDCNHHYHPLCIENWLKVNGTCPICRKKVLGSSVVD